MVLDIYDSNLERHGLIEKIDTLIWNRRYWYCGSFKLLVPFTREHRELLKEGRLIVKPGSKDAGEIRYVHIIKDKQGVQQIEVQGRFVTGWIGKRIVRNQIRATDRPHNLIHRVVRENVTQPSVANRRIHNITHTSAAGIIRNNIEYASEPFMNALLVCESAAKAASLGFGIFADVRAKNFHFDVYDGRDLTTNQTINPPCVFSQEFDNIAEQEFIHSVENLKTTAYVGGEDRQDAPRHIVEVGNTFAGLQREEVFINATDITQSFRTSDGTEVTFTNAQVIEMLRRRGISELEFFAEILSYFAKINPRSNLIYKVDYDLGDRVTCINKIWGIRIDVRITEIAEIYERLADEIEITFGESLPALLDTIRHLY